MQFGDNDLKELLDSFFSATWTSHLADFVLGEHVCNSQVVLRYKTFTLFSLIGITFALSLAHSFEYFFEQRISFNQTSVLHSDTVDQP
jgi:hypothetical protein